MKKSMSKTGKGAVAFGAEHPQTDYKQNAPLDIPMYVVRRGIMRILLIILRFARSASKFEAPMELRLMRQLLCLIHKVFHLCYLRSIWYCY